MASGVDLSGPSSDTADNGMAGMAASLNSSWAIHSALT
jgi:hypothetical protein